MESLLKGVHYLRQSLPLLFAPGIRRYVWIPVCINTVIFSLAIVFFLNAAEVIGEWMTERLPTWLHWLEWMLIPMIVVLLASVIYFGFSVVANFIAAPFNSLLSARIEAKVTAKPPPELPSGSELLRLIRRTPWSECRKLLYQLKWILLLVIVSFIPVLNTLAPILWVCFGIWIMGVEYSEYPMGNRDLYFSDVIRQLRTRRLSVLGFGTPIFLLTLLPVLNFLIMPIGVAAGTLFFIDKLESHTSSR
ncbi:MAG: sulfate transporter CysZ [Pseudomonadota bacterium]